MTRHPDVLVIGGGAIGTSCARALALAGAQVTVVDQPVARGEAWRASAGLLAALVEARRDGPLFELGLAGRAFFRRNTGALRESTGIDIGLLECGVLETVHEGAAIDDFKARIAWQRQRSQHADWLDAREVSDRWPWLSPCLGAFWSPDDGAVDPRQMVAAFRADAIRLGACVVGDTVVALETDGERLSGVIGEQDRYAAGAVVIAAGAWSGRLCNLPRPLSVEPVRGQMISFSWASPFPPAVVYGHGCYLLARNGELLVGATVEHVGFDPGVTSAGITDLHRRATAACSALAGVNPNRHWAGLRPGTPDGLPIIGPEPRLDGLWYATGHGRNGILLAGVTGELVARGIGGDPLEEELAAFRPERFWDG